MEEFLNELAVRIAGYVVQDLEQSKPEESDQLFSVKEVCGMLKISRSTLYRHRDHGLITPTYVGRKPLFTKKAVNEYIKMFNTENCD